MKNAEGWLRDLSAVLMAMLFAVTTGCWAEDKATEHPDSKGKHYQLIYSENNDLCGFVNEKINTRLKERGTIKISMDGDYLTAVNDSTFGFPVWKNTAPNKEKGASYPFSNFDINNDDKDETVVLVKKENDGEILNEPIYRTIAYVVPTKSVDENNPVKPFVSPMLINGVHPVSDTPVDKLAAIDLGQTYDYVLNKLFDPKKCHIGECTIGGAQDIQFLKKDNKIYIMLTERDYPLWLHRKNPRKEFLIIGSYLQGSFGNGAAHDDSGKIVSQEDVIKPSCYFELIKQ